MPEQPRTSARAALFVRVLQQYATAAISFVSVVVLARLLTPAQVGIYSIAAVIVGFLHVFRDFGVKDYVIQEVELTPGRVAAARAMIFVSSWSLGVVLALASVPIARFYSQDSLRAIVLVLSLSFFVIPFGAMTQSFLNRDLRMDALLRISLTSQVASTVISIGAAYAGLGAMSLAIGNLAAVVAATAVARFYRPAALRVRPSLREAKHVLRFSAYSLSNALLMQWQNAAPTLILGRIQSVAAVGLLSRAMGLTQMFQENAAKPVWSIAYPALARSIREGSYRPEFVASLLALVTGLAFPLFAFIGVFAEEIILLLFGPRWLAAAPATQGLVLFAAATVLSTALIQVIKAFGWVARNSIVTVFSAIAVPAAVLALGGQSLASVAIGLSVVRCVETAFRARLAQRCAKLTARHWWRGLAKSIALTLVVLVIAVALRAGLFDLGIEPIVTLVAGAALCAVGWVVAVILVGHDWKVEARRLWRTMVTAVRARLP